MEGSERARMLYGTVSQTVGPFFHIGLKWLFRDHVASGVQSDSGVQGAPITIRGRVLDGDGLPVPDALLEVWQADSEGIYAHPDDPRFESVTPGFTGYARIPTNAQGAFSFTTIKPGRVPAPDGGLQAPHILIAVFMRGLLRQLATRIYFADEPCNEQDVVMLRIPPLRRDTLLAKPLPGSPNFFEWNIILQGDDETVFFDY